MQSTEILSLGLLLEQGNKMSNCNDCCEDFMFAKNLQGNASILYFLLTALIPCDDNGHCAWQRTSCCHPLDGRNWPKTVRYLPMPRARWSSKIGPGDPFCTCRDKIKPTKRSQRWLQRRHIRAACEWILVFVSIMLLRPISKCYCLS